MSSSNLVFLGLALAGTIVGTYTDIKTRLVPDWTNYFVLAAGLGGWAVISVLRESFFPLLYSAAGAAAFFCLGYLLYKAGAWGGGDAKLLTAFGAVFGPFAAVTVWPYLMSLWLNLILFGAIFGIAGMLFLFVKHRRKAVPELKSFLKGRKSIAYTLAAAGLTSAILAFIEPVFVLLLVIVALAISIIVFKSTERACLIKRLSPAELVEGDWIVEVPGCNYKTKKSGVEKGDIKKLIELEREGKIKEVIVKDGLPYLPAFLVALLVTPFFGDLFYKLFSVMFKAVFV